LNHLTTDLLDHAHEFVAERVADPRVGNQAVVEMDVGAADTRTRDADDRIAWMLDPR
jgi:hypothetical protein